jgi:hypothetical protein
MKIVLTIAVLIGGGYIILVWAGDHPSDAREITKQVDRTASGIVDKGERAVKELSH